MTIALSGTKIAQQLDARFPGAVVEANEKYLLLNAPALADVAKYLQETPETAFDYLSHITGVDFLDYFEVAYYLISFTHNHSLSLKVRVEGRENLAIPSVTDIWKGADLQEREIYDLLGIVFTGHPNMKRIVLWEGFPGHPLRKDYLG